MYGDKIVGVLTSMLWQDGTATMEVLGWTGTAFAEPAGLVQVNGYLINPGIVLQPGTRITADRIEGQWVFTGKAV